MESVSPYSGAREICVLDPRLPARWLTERSIRGDEMLAREAMVTEVFSTAPGESVTTAARTMRDADVGFLPVLDDGEVVGVVTDRDLVVRALSEGGPDAADTPIRAVMTTGAFGVSPDDPLEAVAHQMAEHEVRRLLVLDGPRLAGVISYGHLEQRLHASGEAANEATLGVTHGA
jgi:CBS domain-containing protein